MHHWPVRGFRYLPLAFGPRCVPLRVATVSWSKESSVSASADLLTTETTVWLAARYCQPGNNGSRQSFCLGQDTTYVVHLSISLDLNVLYKILTKSTPLPRWVGRHCWPASRL